jgi:SAM-dependent methyltransferase
VAIVSLVRLTSTGAALALGSFFLWRELRTQSGSHGAAAAAHFDSIADEYLDQFPEHVWRHLLSRKLELIGEAIAPERSASFRMLDIGCGLGIQSAELRGSGNTIIGIDVSEGLLRHAAARGVPVAASSVGTLPFPSDSFDAAYAIGILHHLESRPAQEAAFDEIRRILKPGGLFLIHESNPRNPLFRFYFGYAFPMLKSIDEGTERWIDPRVLHGLRGFSHQRTIYFTFLPDFVPRSLMRPLLSVQRLLERSPLREWSVHYFAVLRKSPSTEFRTGDKAVPSRASA